MADYPYHTGLYGTADGGVEELPCKHCSPGKPCATMRGTFDPFPGTDAKMFIQWKGTDVCVDFHCPCQPDEIAYSAHFDGYFAHFVLCPGCGSVYEMGTQVRARLLAPDELPAGEAKELDLDPEAVVPSVRPPGPAAPDPMVLVAAYRELTEASNAWWHAVLNGGADALHGRMVAAAARVDELEAGLR